MGARTPVLRPRLVAPKVAHLMGLGDYCVVNASGARVCYAGNDPNGGGGAPGGNSIPIVSPYEGMFIRATGENAVYLVQGGAIHWVPDQNTLYSLGGDWGLIKDVDPSVLAVFPAGAPETSIQIQQSQVAQAPPPVAATPAPVVSVPAAVSTPVAVPTGNYISTVPIAATATSTFDISSPSTWPTWIWLALAAGASWLLIFKKR